MKSLQQDQKIFIVITFSPRSLHLVAVGGLRAQLELRQSNTFMLVLHHYELVTFSSF